jgi:hypothetical protein
MEVSESNLESGAAADVLSRFHRATTRPFFKRHRIWAGAQRASQRDLFDVFGPSFQRQCPAARLRALVTLLRARREPLPIRDFVTVNLTDEVGVPESAARAQRLDRRRAQSARSRRQKNQAQPDRHHHVAVFNSLA